MIVPLGPQGWVPPSMDEHIMRGEEIAHHTLGMVWLRE
uniref:Uncharacterized protein n=1 Tax=Arundo donax TaxID=35708 RepID=A0A0A9AJG1_ARUDO